MHTNKSIHKYIDKYIQIFINLLINMQMYLNEIVLTFCPILTVSCEPA